MAIPESIIQQITAKVDFLELVGQYTTLQRMGDRYRGLCPFHQEKTPSFYVQPDKRLFYCFGCGKGGNLFQFVMEVEHLTFPDAVHRLAEKVGIHLDPYDEKSLEKGKKQDAILHLLKRVAGSFHYILMQTSQGTPALKYLRARGLEDSIISKFQLGYAPADPYWLKKFLEKKNFSRELLLESGLFAPRSPDRAFFFHRIMFPIYSSQGDVVAFGGRILSGEGPKYLNSAESALFKKGESLYGFYQGREEIRKTRTVVLVEGYMDVIALHQAGIEIAVAPLGTSLTAAQVRLLKRFADRVILFFDQDEAGLQAIRKAAILCEQQELEPFAVQADEYPYKDPADFIQNGQTGELQKIVKYPIPILEFLLKKTSLQKDTGTPLKNLLKVEDLFPYIESMGSEIRREAAIASIADFLELDRESIRKDLQRKKWIHVPQKENREEQKQESIQRTPELVLMILAMESRKNFEDIRSRITLDDLEDPYGRDLYITLEELYREEEWSIDKVCQRISNAALKDFVLSKLISSEFKMNQERLIYDSVRFLKRRNLERERQQVVKAIHRCEKTNQTEELSRLLEKKMYLDAELEKLRVVENE
ncbi:MAG: DNA primase [Spirochaetes bacterium]|nr:DNA primase [Spirochaetota bacterium]